MKSQLRATARKLFPRTFLAVRKLSRTRTLIRSLGGRPLAIRRVISNTCVNSFNSDRTGRGPEFAVWLDEHTLTPWAGKPNQVWQVRLRLSLLVDLDSRWAGVDLAETWTFTSEARARQVFAALPDMRKHFVYTPWIGGDPGYAFI